jgi:hypothetical protein
LRALGKDPNSPINRDRLEFITLEDGRILSAFHDDPLEILDIVHDIEKMTRKPAPVIGLIDSIEFTITSLLRDNMQFESGEITAVISINSNCTKLFFLNGNELFHISPIIYSGVQHRGSANKIYAKVLYELSNEAITGLDRIVILGDDEKNSYKEFFAAKFPDLAIDDLSSLHFHDLMSEPIVDNVLSRYYLAIALALKSANLNNANYYPTNFVPAKVKEKQSVFSIGWHGYLMLAILFICVLGVSVQNRKVSNELKVSQLSLLDIDSELEQLKNVETFVDSMRLKANSIEKGSALLDSVRLGTTRWLGTLEKFARVYTEIGDMHVIKIRANAKNMDFIVDAKSKENVVKLERMLENSKIVSIERVYVGATPVHRVTLKVEVD